MAAPNTSVHAVPKPIPDNTPDNTVINTIDNPSDNASLQHVRRTFFGLQPKLLLVSLVWGLQYISDGYSVGVINNSKGAVQQWYGQEGYPLSDNDWASIVSTYTIGQLVFNIVALSASKSFSSVRLLTLNNLNYVIGFGFIVCAWVWPSKGLWLFSTGELHASLTMCQSSPFCWKMFYFCVSMIIIISMFPTSFSCPTARFFQGAGAGISFPVGIVYIQECAPKELRGTLTVFNICLFITGLEVSLKAVVNISMY